MSLISATDAATKYGYRSADSLNRFTRRVGHEPAGRETGQGGQYLYDEDALDAVMRNRRQGARTDLRSTTVTITDRDMRDQVQLATDASEGTYDVDAITRALIDRYGLVDVDSIPHNEFWTIVLDRATD